MKKILTILCFMAIILPAVASNVTVESQSQTYDGTTNKTYLEGNVKVKMDNMTLTSPRAVVDLTPEGKVEKANFLDRVHAVKEEKDSKQEIRSDIMSMSLLDKKVRAEGNTISTISENDKPVVVLTADYQEYDTKAHLMKAIGNVIIHYEDVVATSNQATMKVDAKNKPEKLKLIGNAVVKQKDSVLTADTVMYNTKSKEFVATGNTHSHGVDEDDGSNFDIYAHMQQYDKVAKSLMAAGSVKMTYQNYIGEGPKATFLSNKKGKINELIFYGRSKVQEGDKIVEANKIRMTARPKTFKAEGNVKTSFKNVENMSDNKNKDSGLFIDMK